MAEVLTMIEQLALSVAVKLRDCFASLAMTECLLAMTGSLLAMTGFLLARAGWKGRRSEGQRGRLRMEGRVLCIAHPFRSLPFGWSVLVWVGFRFIGSR